MTKLRAFDVAAEQPWLITPESFRQVMDIAARVAGGSEDIKALETRLGRPLDNAQTVDIRSNGVAVVPVVGPIFRYANLFTQLSGATSTQVLATDIQTALDNPQVKAIVLNVNSPGGAADGINELASMIREARDVKPIVAYVGGIGASGAYWIASAASRVIVDDTAMLGSIGVVSSIQIEDEKTKARTLEIVSSQSPDKRLDPTTADGRAKIQSVVDSLATVFIETVARNRGTTADDVASNFGRGGLLVGAAAVKAGMADAVGSLESSIAALAGPASTPRSKTLMTAKAKGPVAISTTAELQAALAAGHPAEEITVNVDKMLVDARDAGASAERDRIKAVEASALPGHEALIAEAKFDGKSTASDVALRIVAAEQKRRGDKKDEIRGNGVPNPVVVDAAPKDGAKDYSAIADVKERAAAMFEDDAQFEGRNAKAWGTLDKFTAYFKARAAGKIRLLSK